MRHPLLISRPKLNSAIRLTPLQLNEMKCGVRHTVLTPQLLAEMSVMQNDKTGNTVTQS